MADEKPKYDDTEALHLLADYATRNKGFADEEDRAANDLRRALLALDGRAGFQVQTAQQKDGSIILHLSTAKRAKIEVGYGAAQVQSLEPRGQGVMVKLHYNPATKLLEGEDDDDFLTPEPGKPRKRKRSGLAAVVKAALEAMEAAKG